MTDRLKQAEWHEAQAKLLRAEHHMLKRIAFWTGETVLMRTALTLMQDALLEVIKIEQNDGQVRSTDTRELLTAATESIGRTRAHLLDVIGMLSTGRRDAVWAAIGQEQAGGDMPVPDESEEPSRQHLVDLICQECDQVAEPGDKFCTYCGTARTLTNEPTEPLTRYCWGCASLNRMSARHCRDCGRLLRCFNCGHFLSGEYQFCQDCGTHLRQDEKVSTGDAFITVVSTDGVQHTITITPNGLEHNGTQLPEVRVGGYGIRPTQVGDGVTITTMTE